MPASNCSISYAASAEHSDHRHVTKWELIDKTTPRQLWPPDRPGEAGRRATGRRRARSMIAALPADHWGVL